MYNGSVLARKGGGLPEAGFNNGGAAELSGLVQPVQHLDGRLPIDTRIGDTDAILKSRGAIFRNVLPTGVDIGFDHNASDGAVASNQLLADGIDDLWLVVVVLEGVSVRAIDHNARPVLRARFFESRSSGLDVFSIVVGTLGTTAEDDMDILVAGGLNDGGKTLLGDTHESVRVGGGFHGVHCNTDASISSILEADGEGDTGSKLTVELRLSGTSANSTPRDEISNELGRDGVEKLRTDRHTQIGEVAQELASQAETFVNLEGTVKVRVIDEPLPSHSRAWFLEIGPHDDEEVSPFWDLGFEEFGIGDGLLRGVDRARADDNENPVIVSCQNPGGGVTSGSDGLLRERGRNDLVTKQSRLNEWIVSDNTAILNVALKLSCTTRDRSDTTRCVSRRHFFADWEPPTTVRI